MNAGRTSGCSSSSSSGGGGGGGGRTMVVSSSTLTSTLSVSSSSSRRIVVNGGGVSAVSYVNHCEEALDGRNEMVMSASQVACNDHLSNSVRPSSSFADVAVAYAQTNVKLIESLQAQCATLQKIVSEKADTIKRLTEEMQFYKQDMDNKFKQLHEARAIAAREESLELLPSTPVPSICSSVENNLMAPEQLSAKTKRRRNRPAVNKQPDTNSSEHNQAKKQRTKSRNKPSVVGKIQELSLVTEDKPYYTCLGDFDPVNDDHIPGIKNSNLEIPSWRIKPFTSWYSMEGTENMSDDIFESRHARLELCEQKRKRWDLQRLRELKRIEYLKEGRNKNHLQNDKEEELTTLLPNPANIKAIEITNSLPVSAFGVNLHVKKNAASFKFYHSKWCHDGSQIPNDSNKRGLRSSGRNPLFDLYATMT